MKSSVMEKKVTLRIFGMTCNDCVKTVSEGLKNAGGEEVSLSLDDGMAILKIDDVKISPEDIAKIPVFGEKSRYKAQIRKVE